MWQYLILTLNYIVILISCSDGQSALDLDNTRHIKQQDNLEEWRLDLRNQRIDCERCLYSISYDSDYSCKEICSPFQIGNFLKMITDSTNKMRKKDLDLRNEYALVSSPLPPIILILDVLKPSDLHKHPPSSLVPASPKFYVVNPQNPQTSGSSTFTQTSGTGFHDISRPDKPLNKLHTDNFVNNDVIPANAPFKPSGLYSPESFDTPISFDFLRSTKMPQTPHERPGAFNEPEKPSMYEPRSPKMGSNVYEMYGPFKLPKRQHAGPYQFNFPKIKSYKPVSNPPSYQLDLAHSDDWSTNPFFDIVPPKRPENLPARPNIYNFPENKPHKPFSNPPSSQHYLEYLDDRPQFPNERPNPFFDIVPPKKFHSPPARPNPFSFPENEPHNPFSNPSSIQPDLEYPDDRPQFPNERPNPFFDLAPPKEVHSPPARPNPFNFLENETHNPFSNPSSTQPDLEYPDDRPQFRNGRPNTIFDIERPKRPQSLPARRNTFNFSENMPHKPSANPLSSQLDLEYPDDRPQFPNRRLNPIFDVVPLKNSYRLPARPNQLYIPEKMPTQPSSIFNPSSVGMSNSRFDLGNLNRPQVFNGRPNQFNDEVPAKRPHGSTYPADRSNPISEPENNGHLYIPIDKHRPGKGENKPPGELNTFYKPKYQSEMKRDFLRPKSQPKSPSGGHHTIYKPNFPRRLTNQLDKYHNEPLPPLEYMSINPSDVEYFLPTENPGVPKKEYPAGRNTLLQTSDAHETHYPLNKFKRQEGMLRKTVKPDILGRFNEKGGKEVRFEEQPAFSNFVHPDTLFAGKGAFHGGLEPIYEPQNIEQSIKEYAGERPVGKHNTFSSTADSAILFPLENKKDKTLQNVDQLGNTFNGQRQNGFAIPDDFSQSNIFGGKRPKPNSYEQLGEESANPLYGENNYDNDYDQHQPERSQYNFEEMQMQNSQHKNEISKNDGHSKFLHGAHRPVDMPNGFVQPQYPGHLKNLPTDFFLPIEELDFFDETPQINDPNLLPMNDAPPQYTNHLTTSPSSQIFGPSNTNVGQNIPEQNNYAPKRPQGDVIVSPPAHSTLQQNYDNSKAMGSSQPLKKSILLYKPLFIQFGRDTKAKNYGQYGERVIVTNSDNNWVTIIDNLKDGQKLINVPNKYVATQNTEQSKIMNESHKQGKAPISLPKNLEKKELEKVETQLSGQPKVESSEPKNAAKHFSENTYDKNKTKGPDNEFNSKNFQAPVSQMQEKPKIERNDIKHKSKAAQENKLSGSSPSMKQKKKNLNSDKQNTLRSSNYIENLTTEVPVSNSGKDNEYSIPRPKKEYS